MTHAHSRDLVEPLLELGIERPLRMILEQVLNNNNIFPALFFARIFVRARDAWGCSSPAAAITPRLQCAIWGEHVFPRFFFICARGFRVVSVMRDV